MPLPVFVTGAVLTALAGLGGVAAGGLWALTEHDRIAAMDPRLPRDGSGVRDAALAADVLDGTTGALAVGTIVLALLTDFDGEPAPTDDRATGTAMRLAEVPVSGASAVTVALDGSTLALGWSEDCGASPARIRLFAVAGTTLTPGPEATLSRGADALCITRQGVLEEWGIALEDAEGWWLERRDDGGAELGPPVPVRGIVSEVRPLVRARASGGAYEIFGAEAGLFVDAGRLTLDTVACLP